MTDALGPKQPPLRYVYWDLNGRPGCRLCYNRKGGKPMSDLGAVFQHARSIALEIHGSNIDKDKREKHKEMWRATSANMSHGHTRCRAMFGTRPLCGDTVCEATQSVASGALIRLILAQQVLLERQGAAKAGCGGVEP